MIRQLPIPKTKMINKKLTCHTKTEHSDKQSINIEVDANHEQGLQINYRLNDQLALLLIPTPQPAIACDGLSEHTCFEVFIAVEGESGYHEFNFSPSGQWAAYAFSDYRSISKWKISRKPYIHVTHADNKLSLEATIPYADLPLNPDHKPFQLGLSAVLEANDGSRSFWALHHPAGRPDFHKRAGFTCILKNEKSD